MGTGETNILYQKEMLGEHIYCVPNGLIHPENQYFFDFFLSIPLPGWLESDELWINPSIFIETFPKLFKRAA